MLQEIQLRTLLQHYWATAVETAGTIYGNEYKSPRVRDDAVGDDIQRLRFFALCSSLFAQKENSAPVPSCEGSCEAIIKQLRSMPCHTDILQMLRAATDGVDPLHVSDTGNDGGFYLMRLSTPEQLLDIKPIPTKNFESAIQQYDLAEGKTTPESFDQVVLVYTRNLKQLDEAYLNYRSDVSIFGRKIAKYVGFDWDAGQYMTDRESQDPFRAE